MKATKQAVAWLLISSFAFNMLGYCLFSVLIVTHKKSVFHEIVSGEFGNEELCSFRVSDVKNARWEHEREFELNEEMYDVVKTETKDGDVVYTCKKDSKEDHLKKQKRKAAEKSAAKKMVEMTKIFVQPASINKNNFIETITRTQLGLLKDDYVFYFSALTNPPPKA